MNSSASRTFTFLDAAVRVLRTRRRPMTVAEITAEALRLGILHTAGKTPEKTMSAALYQAAGASDSPVRRIYEPGPQRARRSTVRWQVT